MTIKIYNANIDLIVSNEDLKSPINASYLIVELDL